MPGRFSPANERLPSKSGRSSSESGRSPSERTLVQRVDARRPANERSSPSDARPAKKPASGRSPSERTLVQRVDACRPVNERSSPSENARPANSGLDARLAINGRSPSDGLSPSDGRSPSEKSLTALLFKNAIQRQKWRLEGRRPEDAAELVLGASKVENHQFPPFNPCFIASMMYTCS
ncbi:hypothetical protein LR48_Vigan05g106700 [Vigna angularis]|uniref:Uncharacterized protein n=1 Tax=Phaseolus angularis TaxID=3914 RepID=A0A0L9UL54_PHAAN|nr:hypothetical protein LR48_Vigan05g106700 [Vigna angularis]